MIVNLHWGSEYVQAVTPAQRALAQRLTLARDRRDRGPAAHVVQPIRRVNGKPVVFGEGNLISNQTAACCATAAQDGLIALIDFVVRPGKPRARRGFATCPPGSATRHDRATRQYRAPPRGTAR